ncbi:hypothetical protein CRV08_05055 [Halarcobacter ebronensis]|uniref:Hydrogenase-4 component G n=1 Tax=Halarcobacter ebronensis TaxID=1462615 RepID=A0A4Q0YHY2_9BACT|nr:hypothetical protein [Halarcobacter ebronensis]RXJ69374.1 hypothetical protein CRV08_05055 [Halarcobacter ebronensis]
METLELNNNIANYKAYDSNVEQELTKNQNQPKDSVIDDSSYRSKIHNSAVNVSISMESLKVYLNIKSSEFTYENSNTQRALINIIDNENIYDFLSGKEINNGFSLADIGYTGKAITDLTADEAKELVSDEGFFGVTETSNRVSSFVIGLAGDDVKALEEVRAGVVKSFEEAEKLWGGELPEISYKTQERTLSLIDEKIASLTKTDLEKEVENKTE